MYHQAGYIERSMNFDPRAENPNFTSFPSDSATIQGQTNFGHFQDQQQQQSYNYGSNFHYQQQQAQNFAHGYDFQDNQQQHFGQGSTFHDHQLQQSGFNFQDHRQQRYFQSEPAGRPSHAVVAFGFGGTLAVIRPSPGQVYHESPRMIEIHNLNTLVPPPAGLEANPTENKSKYEALRWIQDRREKCPCEEVPSPPSLPLLWGALKIAFEHHGRIRTPAGVSIEGNGPEAALGQMILSASSSASAGSNDCLSHVPTEAALQATARKVNGLMLCGKIHLALQCAEEGKLWGTALVLASRLGESYYSATTSKMASELAPGPLRTISLIMGGQSAQLFAEGVLENWHETLAVLATNTTMGAESILVQLGDTLWQQNGEVAAAHLCYILVDQNSEMFFEDGRISLLGADHWRQPRTFVTPLAIKRTEIYEHLKRMCNPQFVLKNFQPYKIVLAQLLAEAGYCTEALKCCQAASKTLSSSNFAHFELVRQAASDLEKRLSGSLGCDKGTLTGRILSSTFSFVKSSLPTAPRLTRYNSSTSINNKEKAEAIVKAPPRSISEPDFSKSDASTPAPNGGGLLRRIGSSVYQRAAGMVSPRQAKEPQEQVPQEPQAPPEMVVSSGYTQDYGHPPLPVPRKSSGLYVQCADYYSRCMSTQFVQALPTVASFKFLPSTPAAPRLEV